MTTNDSSSELFLATARKGEQRYEKHGWVSKKYGKNRWMAVWLEFHIFSDVVTCYTDNPQLGYIRASCHDSINLDGAKFKLEDNPRKSRFTINIREKATKRHVIVTQTKEERDEWKELFEKAQEFITENTFSKFYPSLETPETLKGFIKDGTDVFEMTAPHQFYYPLPEIDEDFWNFKVQDHTGALFSMKDIVGSRLTVFVTIGQYGSPLCLSFLNYIVSLLDFLEDMGLQIVVIGSGSAPVLSEITKEKKIPHGDNLILFCDQTSSFTGLLKSRMKTISSTTTATNTTTASSNGSSTTTTTTTSTATVTNPTPANLAAFTSTISVAPLTATTSTAISLSTSNPAMNSSAITSAIAAITATNVVVPTSTSTTVSSLFGFYAVHSNFGIIYSWAAPVSDVFNKIDTSNINSSNNHNHHFQSCNIDVGLRGLVSGVKLFYLVESDDCWSHLAFPQRKWNMLKSSNLDVNANHVIDRASGYEYELGCNNPPPGQKGLIDNIYPFRDKFAKIDHVVFAVEDDDFGPSIVCLEQNVKPIQCSARSIVIGRKGITKVLIPGRYSSLNPKEMLKYLALKIYEKPLEKLKFTPLEDEAVSEAITKLESQIYFTQYKFGVLFAKSGAIGEEDMYANTETSEDFDEFMRWLGKKITLSGWKQFRGGLDTRGTDCTGPYSYYTEFNKQEIMFHVALEMPIKDNDPSRKRYIGNDVVVIIFKEGPPSDKFDAQSIRSQFNHIFAVVAKVSTPNGPAYKIEIGQKPAVPTYPPFFPDPPVFPINAQTRNLFLTKLINSERTTITHVPIFRANMATTREALLADLIKNFTSNKKPAPKKPTEEPEAAGVTATTTTATTTTATTTTTTTETITDNSNETSNNNSNLGIPENIDYDKLEEQILLALCAENQIKYSNVNNAVEQLAVHYFGAK